jgi:uncharacterized membrane protein YccC
MIFFLASDEERTQAGIDSVIQHSMNDDLRKTMGGMRALAAGLARDFAPWPRFGARFVDEIECLGSVLLAIALARLLGVDNVGWAAFSAYMVIRASFAESLSRGSLRVLGTAVGASLACLLAPELLRSPLSLSMALALAGAGTLYLALLDRRGYAWLFVGLTFAMVLIDGMEHPGEALAAFAQLRFVEVLAGTCASILVSAASALTLRRQLPALSAEATQQAQNQMPAFQFWHKVAFRHALQGAAALALIPWAWTALHIQALSQSSVTIMVVMMVPVSSLLPSNPVNSANSASHPGTVKLLHRLFGCVIGGLLATAILALSHASPVIMTLAACLGILAGRHIENGKLGIGYVGTQFALAFLVVLVPDSYASASITPGVERLSGILFGMVLLEPVRLLFRQFAALRHACVAS